MMAEYVQVLTDAHGYETLCTVDPGTNWIVDLGISKKAEMIVNGLTYHYPHDKFRVMGKFNEQEIFKEFGPTGGKRL